MKASVRQGNAVRQFYDPDPVAIAILIVGIIGAVPGAAQVQRWVRERGLSGGDTQRAEATLNGILDELSHLAVSFAAVKEIVIAADLPLDSPFQLGHALWLDKAQYKRYVENTQDIFARGARIEKAAHKLETMTPRHDRGPVEDNPQTSELLTSLNRLFYTRDLSIGSALTTIEYSLTQSKDLISSLRDSLRPDAYQS